MTKPTWYFICGPYRTASTTQYEIVRDLVEETNSGKGVGYYDQKRWKVKNFDKPEHGEIIVCKNFEYLPEKDPKVRSFLDENRLRACATIRNPLDIVTSMKIRSKRLEDNDWSFEELVTEFFPQWLANFEQWVNNLHPDRILVLRYEWYTTHLREATESLRDFLEVPASDELVTKIAIRYDKDAIMRRKNKAHKKGEKEDEWLPAIPAIVTGRSDIYKEHLTEKEIALVREANEAFLKRWNYA